MAYKGKPIEINKLKEIAKSAIGLDFYPEISDDGKEANFTHKSGVQIRYRQYTRMGIASIQSHYKNPEMSIDDTKTSIATLETAVIIAEMIKELQ